MLVSSVLLTLALTQTAAPLQLAVVRLEPVNVSEALASALEETVGLRLAEGGLAKVTTRNDVIAMLGLERQRQLLGCSEGSNCTAELAGALGAEGIVRGEVAKLGDVYQLNVKVLSSSGAPLYSTLRRVGSEEALLREVDGVAREALASLRFKLRGIAPPEPVGPWVLVGVGGAVLVGGVIAEVLAVLDYTSLQSATEPNQLRRLRDEGKIKQTLGLSLMGVGAATLAAGLVWRLLGVERGPVTAWVQPGAAGVVWAGAWP
ncbi:MAG: hypothetical protein SFW67_13805 [Myxococcaceae bacterium]|nr:hypothetical protein [Myxococcaceae bacterium]